MRELAECTAEVFRRSEQRISQRRKRRKYAIALCIPLCLCAVLSLSFLPGILQPQQSNGSGAMNQNPSPGFAYDGLTSDPSSGSAENFCFSLTWGCYGISSYDSATGKLVKSTDATHPEDYVTTCRLTSTQLKQIYDLIQQLDVTGYPDTYDPHRGKLASNPTMTLILSVQTNTIQKTITAQDIALTYEASNRQGQKFLTVCQTIINILTETGEWKALPEYENFYD